MLGGKNLQPQEASRGYGRNRTTTRRNCSTLPVLATSLLECLPSLFFFQCNLKR
jgi:hypothetical protein